MLVKSYISLVMSTFDMSHRIFIYYIQHIFGVLATPLFFSPSEAEVKILARRIPGESDDWCAWYVSRTAGRAGWVEGAGEWRLAGEEGRFCWA